MIISLKFEDYVACKAGITLIAWKIRREAVYEVGLMEKVVCYCIIKGCNISAWESKSKLMAFYSDVSCKLMFL